MALYFGNLNETHAGTSLIDAVPGKSILITRVVFSSWKALGISLMSDPLGDDERELLPTMRAGGGVPVALELGRDFGVAADVGKGVGLVAQYESATGPFSLLIWYEVVG